METLYFRSIRTFLLSWIVLFFAVLFVGCDSTAPNVQGDTFRNAYGEDIPWMKAPPRACYKGTLDTRTDQLDTVFYAAAYPLVVSKVENRRNRCFLVPITDEVYCYNSARDSVFAVDNLCSFLLSFSPTLSECQKYQCEIGRG